VGYGVFAATDVFAGEGSPAVDPAAGSSIARLFANVDTNDNASDFAAGAPTPGSAAFASVPEPTAATLLGSGLVGLAWQGRRRSNAPAAAQRGAAERRRQGRRRRDRG
jgi:hypothetical protein